MKNEKLSKKNSITKARQTSTKRASKYESIMIPGVFVDPKNDVAFKKLFGDDNHKSVTINFLNSMLSLSGDEAIKEIEFLKSEIVPDNLFGKKIYLDVFCTNVIDKQFIIEMQSVSEFNFIQRSQMYAARTLSTQLFKGQKYEELIPVIFLGIVDFTLFEDDKNIISTYEIKNRATGQVPYQSLLTWHYVELSKFTIKIDEIEKLKTLHDKWFYFLKYADGLKVVPDELHELKEAFSVIEQLRWSKQDLLNYSEVDEAIAQAKRQQEGAALRAKAEGLEEGLQKGLQKGLEEGLQKGVQKTQKESAINALQLGLTVEQASAISGLSVDVIKKLKK